MMKLFYTFLVALAALLSSHAAMYSDFATMTAGGYSAVTDDRQHPRLQQAAEFAVTQAMELQKYSFLTSLATTSNGDSLPPIVICKAYQQVVAGMNLRMVIMVQDEADDSCLGAFAVTIYDRFGELSVTDWSPSPVSCETAQSMLSGAYASTGALESFFN